MKKILFVCTQNALRSPTAERVFAGHAGLEVKSAGTSEDANQPMSQELIDWADMIVVMEKHHRNRLMKKFGSSCREKRLIVLDIPDEYEFMEEGLVRLLKAKMARYLPI